MFKAIIVALLMLLSFTLYGCSSGISGLQHYVNTANGYEFFYPNGWVQVDVRGASDGVDIVFRDIVERTESLSVIVSSVPDNKTLEDLGTSSEVGYRLLKIANSGVSGTPPCKGGACADRPAAVNANREAEFISALSRQTDGKTYYLLEYEVKLPDERERHNLASVAVSRGKLFTFNLSTQQSRWNKVEDAFKAIASSFTVY